MIVLFVLWLWTRYWRLCYGVPACVIPGGYLDPRTYVTWTEIDVDGTELPNVADGPARELLRLMPVLTRLIAKSHRARKGAKS